MEGVVERGKRRVSEMKNDGTENLVEVVSD